MAAPPARKSLLQIHNTFDLEVVNAGVIIWHQDKAERTYLFEVQPKAYRCANDFPKWVLESDLSPDERWMLRRLGAKWTDEADVNWCKNRPVEAHAGAPHSEDEDEAATLRSAASILVDMLV